MYPHSGRGGPYRGDREEEYIGSRYLNQQHLRAPASGSFSSRATSSDRYYPPHRMEPPVDYRERDLEVSLHHMIQNKYQISITCILIVDRAPLLIIPKQSHSKEMKQHILDNRQHKTLLMYYDPLINVRSSNNGLIYVLQTII